MQLAGEQVGQGQAAVGGAQQVLALKHLQAGKVGGDVDVDARGWGIGVGLDPVDVQHPAGRRLVAPHDGLVGGVGAAVQGVEVADEIGEHAVAGLIAVDAPLASTAPVPGVAAVAVAAAAPAALVPPAACRPARPAGRSPFITIAHARTLSARQTPPLHIFSAPTDGTMRKTRGPPGGIGPKMCNGEGVAHLHLEGRRDPAGKSAPGGAKGTEDVQRSGGAAPARAPGGRLPGGARRLMPRSSPVGGEGPADRLGQALQER